MNYSTTPVLLLFCVSILSFPHLSHCQKHSNLISVSDMGIIVTNDLGFTHRFDLIEEGVTKKTYRLDPGKKIQVPVEINRRTVKHLKVKYYYDKSCYERDLVHIENIAEARARRRRNNALFLGLIAAADEYFFDGAGGKVVSIINSINTLSSKMTPEQKAEALIKEWGPGIAIGQIDDRTKRAAATGAFTTMEMLLSEPNNDDLVRLTQICFVKYLESPSQEIPVRKYADFYPSYTFSLAAMYPLSSKVTAYNGEEFEDDDTPLQSYTDYQNSAYLPFELRVQNTWVQANSGFLTGLNLIFAQTPVFYDITEDGTILGQNTGFVYRQVGAELGLGFRPIGKHRKAGVNLMFSFGATAGYRSDVDYTGDEPSSSSDLEFSSYEYELTSAVIGINVTVDLSVLMLQYTYRGNAAFTEVDDIEENYFNFNAHSVGLALPLARRYKRY